MFTLRTLRNCCATLLMSLFTYAVFAAPEGWQAAALPSTYSFDIKSRHTEQTYRIFVGVPEGERPPEGYPTLWMLDGGASYPITQFARTGGSRAQRLPGLIVAVGYASDKPFDVDARALDYTPVPDADTGDRLSPRFGGADAFLRFMVDELRPVIAAHFKLDPTRQTLFGFSYGGLFTVRTLVSSPRHFQRYWAASPSLWFSDAIIMRALEKSKTPQQKGVERVVITAGMEEQYPTAQLPPDRVAHLKARAVVDNVRKAAESLRNSGAAPNVEAIVAADHDHFDMLMHGARRVIDFAFAP